MAKNSFSRFFASLRRGSHIQQNMGMICEKSMRKTENTTNVLHDRVCCDTTLRKSLSWISYLFVYSLFLHWVVCSVVFKAYEWKSLALTMHVRRRFNRWVPKSPQFLTMEQVANETVSLRILSSFYVEIYIQSKKFGNRINLKNIWEFMINTS